MISWQIINPALVMSLSSVLYHWILLQETASNRLGLIKFLVILAPNVSFAVKSLTLFAKFLFCVICIAWKNSLLLMSPNTGSFHGKNQNVGTFGTKHSLFCPLMHKLPPKLPNLQLKKHRSQQPTFIPPFQTPAPTHPLKWAVFSAPCSCRNNPAVVVAKHGRRMPYTPFPVNMAEDENHNSLYLT